MGDFPRGGIRFNSGLEQRRQILVADQVGLPHDVQGTASERCLTGEAGVLSKVLSGGGGGGFEGGSGGFKGIV